MHGYRLLYLDSSPQLLLPLTAFDVLVLRVA
jgi:hypothetical protein